MVDFWLGLRIYSKLVFIDKLYPKILSNCTYLIQGISGLFI